MLYPPHCPSDPIIPVFPMPDKFCKGYSKEKIKLPKCPCRN